MEDVAVYAESKPISKEEHSQGSQVKTSTTSLLHQPDYSSVQNKPLDHQNSQSKQVISSHVNSILSQDSGSDFPYNMKSVIYKKVSAPGSFLREHHCSVANELQLHQKSLSKNKKQLSSAAKRASNLKQAKNSLLLKSKKKELANATGHQFADSRNNHSKTHSFNKNALTFQTTAAVQTTAAENNISQD